MVFEENAGVLAEIEAGHPVVSRSCMGALAVDAVGDNLCIV